MPTTTIPDALLTLKRTYATPRPIVFRAFTNPSELKRWWGPPGYETVSADVDLRPGGRYRFGMRKVPDGEPFYLSGAYRVVDAPSRLVYTWTWEHVSEVKDTVVTVEFTEVSGGTEVSITHELLPSLEQREKHAQGWGGCLDRLTNAL